MTLMVSSGVIWDPINILTEKFTRCATKDTTESFFRDVVLQSST